jgi:hypothetical protein
MHKRENILYVLCTTLQGYLNNASQQSFCENPFPIFPQLWSVAAPNEIHFSIKDLGRNPMPLNGALDLGFYSKIPAIPAVNNEGNIIILSTVAPVVNQGMSPQYRGG